MKKYSILVVCALMLFALAGCGKDKVVCKGTLEEDGLSADAEMIAEFDKDIVSDITVNYTLKDEETAKTWCALFQLMQDESKGVTVKCSGKKITIKGMDKMDSEDEDETPIKTKEEFIKYAEEEGKLKCK